MTDAQQTALERATAELHGAAIFAEAMDAEIDTHPECVRGAEARLSTAARVYARARREAGL
jgi:hypothetical protein